MKITHAAAKFSTLYYSALLSRNASPIKGRGQKAIQNQGGGQEECTNGPFRRRCANPRERSERAEPSCTFWPQPCFLSPKVTITPPFAPPSEKKHVVDAPMDFLAQDPPTQKKNRGEMRPLRSEKNSKTEGGTKSAPRELFVPISTPT